MREDSTELKPFAWSYSGARLFDSCPRAFFYRYQATSPSEETGNNAFDPETEYIGSPGALVGTAVHQSIGREIDSWRKGGSPSMKGAQSFATEIIRQYCDTHDFSVEDGENATDAHTRHDPPRIQDSLSRTANSHLQTFFQVIWPQFTSHQYILHETTDSISVHRHIALVRPDLCTRDSDGRLVITDWKTGPIDRQDQSTQLEVYALWAHRNYEPDLNRITVQRVHTGTGEFDRVAINRQQIDELIERIISDCEDWNSRRSRSEFPTNPEPLKCHRCPYLQQCNDGQNII